jgi:hypothetical protein
VATRRNLLHRGPAIRRLLTAIVVVASAGIAVAQPEPWSHPDNTIHWYDAVATPGGMDWRAAGDSAASRGGYLATITSDRENAFVFELCDRESLWSELPDSALLSGPWLGGCQPPGARRAEEGWRWVTGEPFDFRNWSEGEPDDMGGEENALHFGSPAMQRVPTWDDIGSEYSNNPGCVVELSAETTTVGLVLHDSAACPGYTLLAPMSSAEVYLLDNKGRPVHRWTSDYGSTMANHLLDNGLLLRLAYGPVGGAIQLLDWSSNLVWQYEPGESTYYLHHDVIALPSGNLLAIAYERRTRTEAMAAGRDPVRLLESYLLPDCILEIDPSSDSVVWEWHVWDHLVQDFDSTRANFGVVRDHPELIDVNFGPNRADWQHCNGVDYNTALDQIIISSRNFSEIWVIDHSTTTEQARGHEGGRQGMGGDLLYRWGNPQAYRAGDSTDQHFFGQHNAQWIRAGLRGAGNILVFNNGIDSPGPLASTVEEVTPPSDSSGGYRRPTPGRAFGPLTPSWLYGAPAGLFYSGILSGAQRLPNGNTLICEGTSGRIFEVAADSQLAWTYVNPVSEAGHLVQGSWDAAEVFRAVRYPTDYSGLAGRQLRAGYPLERYEAPAMAVAEPAARAPRPVAGLSVTPSPAYGPATVRYSLPSAGPVRLAVYDNTGRRVRTLLSSPAADRSGTLDWNGLDESGRAVGAGVYVVRLTAGSVVGSARLTVAK